MEQTNQPQTEPITAPELQFDLGSFEGFNFRSQSAIERLLTADEVVHWEHDADGEAEFWPAGDHPGVAVVFEHRTAVTAADLLAVDRLLLELGGDAFENFLRIHFTVNCCGYDLQTLTAGTVEDQALHLFEGTNFQDLRREAAYELFELYYPEAYAAWERSCCDGLIFDTDRFLNSPSFSVEEIRLGEHVALIVAPQ
ncbi:MAG: hypothetical protein HS113_19090 [Verrucomicrobiales bacterium]|nr:hypothetical protein [Verrucomicrobiales bacterium]